ncbi:MAG: YtxH domain-containing protein [Candidatus Caenarcaniphilales bacterium]|nr:YtxH domain-containing protein [Candidatus Caenarcaniphilales bacterium]
MSKNENGFGDFLGGFLLGSVVGAAIAALTTPYSGEEAKKEAESLYKKGLEKSEEFKHKAEESLTELSASAKLRATGVIGKLKDKASSIANRFDELTNKGAGVLIEDEIV